MPRAKNVVAEAYGYIMYNCPTHKIGDFHLSPRHVIRVTRQMIYFVCTGCKEQHKLLLRDIAKEVPR